MYKCEGQLNMQMTDKATVVQSQNEELKVVGNRYNILNNSVKDLSDQYRVISDKL